MPDAQAEVTILWTPVGGSPIFIGVSLETATAFIETKALDIGDKSMSYFIDRIVSHISNRTLQTNLILELYGSDDEETDFELLDTIVISKEDPGFTDASGKKYYKLRWVDSSVIERWRLHGFSVYGEPGGDEF